MKAIDNKHVMKGLAGATALVHIPLGTHAVSGRLSSKRTPDQSLRVVAAEIMRNSCPYVLVLLLWAVGALGGQSEKQQSQLEQARLARWTPMPLAGPSGSGACHTVWLLKSIRAV